MTFIEKKSSCYLFLFVFSNSAFKTSFFYTHARARMRLNGNEWRVADTNTHTHTLQRDRESWCGGQWRIPWHRSGLLVPVSLSQEAASFTRDKSLPHGGFVSQSQRWYILHIYEMMRVVPKILLPPPPPTSFITRTFFSPLFIRLCACVCV